MFERVKAVIRSIVRGKNKNQPSKTARIIEKSEHRIDPELVSWQAKKTCEALNSRGYKAYIVGGAVRDLLLGVTPKDFDVVTDATPEQIKRCQRRAIIIGRRFRLVHVIFGREIIECSTFRALDAFGVRKDSEGRVISDNVFGTMWEDAARRDFTINALFYDPVTERIHDYHHGFEDIKRKRVRMIGDPEVRYREDPVRMMRAVRISAKLGFKIDPATERPIARMAQLIENIPAARLFDEVMKLFTSGHAEACLLKLRKEELHHSLLPMLDVIFREPKGEEFLLMALRRTDERIASGKKISPSFMFATLLWPQVKKRWDAYLERPKMTRMTALYAASEDVIATQTEKLAIQNRFKDDMRRIWQSQIRFERRTGKNPYAVVEMEKYRACYDFLLLRSLLGYVSEEVVQWWDAFAQADEQTRANMVAEQETLARSTGDLARSGSRRSRSRRSRATTEERFVAEVPAGDENRQAQCESENASEGHDSAAPHRRRRRRHAPRPQSENADA